MNNEVLNLTYASSLTRLCEINSSFDSGILRIAYAGENRNGSAISKSSFEKCLNTIYNCPVVCNYDRETETLGGHDMELVHDNNGNYRLVNITQPIGVIPESAKVFWETVEEEDGVTREYLCAEALIWKRQEAYKKIKEDGITAQSMEITVKNGKTIDGVYHIENFEFTAFALIGCEPCFESASLSFSKQDFKQQLSEMMLELKESFSKVTTSNEDDNKSQKQLSMEGGEKVLDKNELIAKYGIDVEALDFSIEELSYEELEEKFKAMQEAKPEGVIEPATDPIVEPETKDNFALTSNILEEIHRALSSVKMEREWGECTRYCFVDCDLETMEVYCWDASDWMLYGFSYKLNGDNVEIDFESKKRKKFVIADFDEGEQDSAIAHIFELMEQKLHEGAEIAAKYQTASDTIATMEKELGELRQYKSDAEDAIARGERDEVFAQFEDLVGVEAFENLKENCMNYELEAIEEKCYAIRGRQGSPVKFSMEPKVPKLPIEKEHKEKLPYGGLHEKFGFSVDKK